MNVTGNWHGNCVCQYVYIYLLSKRYRDTRGRGDIGLAVKRKLGLFLSAALLVVIISALRFSCGSPEIVQPIQFNHYLHIEEQGLDCIDCHTQVETHPRATLPAVEICSDCHSDALTETEEEQLLLAFTIEEVEIPWERIYEVGNHVYFSHRRHVSIGEVQCESCHGDVPQLIEPPEQPIIAISMDNCMECHREHQITNDCLSCHR